MRLVTLASLRGAPGVTTTALLLAAGIEDAAVVEADLDGGVLAVRYGLGREPGLTTFAAAATPGPATWLEHAQSAGGVPLLVGPDVPSAAVSLWRTAGERITDRLVHSDGFAVVDAGRLRFATPLIVASELVVILVRPVAEHLVALQQHLPVLQAATRGQVAAVVVGPGPYRRQEIHRDLGIGVLAELPDDPTAAAALQSVGGSSARLRRSRLVRAVAGLCESIVASSEAGDSAARSDQTLAGARAS